MLQTPHLRMAKLAMRASIASGREVGVGAVRNVQDHFFLRRCALSLWVASLWFKGLSSESLQCNVLRLCRCIAYVATTSNRTSSTIDYITVSTHTGFSIDYILCEHCGI